MFYAWLHYTCLLVICLFISTHAVKAQTTPFQIADSALSLMDHGQYDAGWQHIAQVPPEYIDPADWSVVAQYAFLQNDTTRFFKILENLIKNHGFRLMKQYAGMAYYEALSTGQWAEWFRGMQAKLLPLFYASRVHVLDEINKLDEIRLRDQLRQGIPQALQSNPECRDAVRDTLIAYLDNINYAQLLSICRTNGFPNDFDLHCSATSTAYLVLWHSCADSAKFMSRWAAIWPYLDEAYEHGKINNSYVITYDYFIAKYFGYQLYGTVSEEVPVRDSIKLMSRREKYNLR